MTLLAVIIPHYNDSVRLGRCLAALETADRSRVEVIVADNCSTEDLGGLRDAHPWARFVEEPGRGAALARNRGVAESTAPWIAFLDADCLPEPDWLARAVQIAGRDEAGVVTGGMVSVFDETEGPRTGAQAFETVFAFDQEGYIAHKGFSVSANLITARSMFEKAGPFRTGVSEDLEWCRRATAAGARLVYDPGLAVQHPTRGDWAALERKWRRLTEEGYGVDGQGARLRWAVKALAMPASALAHGPRIVRHPVLAPGEKLRALGTLVRLRNQRMAWMLRQALRGQSATR